MRTETVFLARNDKRNADTAAKLLGLDCADAFVELAVREKLATLPAIEEYGKRIAAAISKERRAWESEHLSSARE